MVACPYELGGGQSVDIHRNDYIVLHGTPAHATTKPSDRIHMIVQHMFWWMGIGENVSPPPRAPYPARP